MLAIRKRRRRLAMSLLATATFLAAVAWFVSRPTEREEAVRLRRSAEMVAAEGRTAVAAELLREAVELLPGDAELWAYLGRILVIEEDDEGAADAFERAVALVPHHVDANLGLARLLLADAALDETLAHAEAALQGQPVPAEAYVLRAEVALRRGQARAALTDYLAAAEAGGDDPWHWLRAAFVADQLGRFAADREVEAQGRRCFEAATARLEGNSPQAARARLGLGMPAQALAILDAMEDSSDPDAAQEAAIVRAAAHLAARNGRTARSVLAARIERAPSAPLYGALVDAHLAENRIGEARQALTDAESRFPDDPHLWKARLALQSRMAMLSRVDDLLLPEFDLRWSTVDSHAVGILTRMRETADDDLSRRAWLGIAGPGVLAGEIARSAAAQDDGPDGDSRASAARARFEEHVAALARDPRGEEGAATWAAGLALARGRPARALDLLQPALEADPIAGRTHCLRAIALQRLGRWTESVQAAESALADGHARPGRPAALVRALTGAGRIRDAIDAGRLAVERHGPDLHLLAALIAADDAARQQSRGGRHVGLGREERDLYGAWFDLARGDTERVAAAARAVLRERPHAPEAHGLLALAWEQAAGQFAAAAALAEGAEARELLVLQALAFERAGLVERAVEGLSAQLATDRDGTLRAALGGLLIRKGELASARGLLEGHAASAAVAHTLGIALRQAGDEDGARTLFRRALDSDGALAPQAAAAWALLQVPVPREDDVDRVTRWLSSQPADETRAYLLLAAHLAWLRGETPHATQLVEEHVAAHPNDPAPWVLRARLHLGAGDLAAAERAAAHARNLASSDRDVRALLARIRISRGLAAQTQESASADTASRWFEAAVDDVATDGLAVVLLSRALARSDRASVAAVAQRLEATHPHASSAPLFRAESARVRGAPTLAAAHYMEALLRDPQLDLALAGYGEAALAAGKLEELGRVCTARLADAQDDAWARTLLGRVHERNGDLGEAERAYERALASSPGHADAALRLAGLLLRNGRNDAARDVARRARAAASDARVLDPGLLILAGGPDATADLTAHLRIGADPAATHLALARVHLAAGDAEGARGAAEAAIEADAGRRNAYALLLISYLRTGEEPLAVQRLEQLRERYPDSPGPAFALAMVASNSGDASAAERLYRDALSRAPEDALILNNLAWIVAVDLSRPADAVDYAERAYRAFPAEPDVAETYGWVQFLRGRADLAIEPLGAVVNARPTCARAYVRLAEAHAVAGNAAEARRTLDAAKRLDAALVAEDGIEGRIERER